MWSIIIATLRLALTPLTIAEALLRNLDTNAEGVDDQIADGLKKAIEIINGVASTDDGVPGQARGLIAISAFCRGVLAKLDELIASGTPPYSDAVKAEAKAQVDLLSNPAKVYQAKRGADAQALSDAKTAAATKLAQIES